MSEEDTVRHEDNMCLSNFDEAEEELRKALMLLAEAKKLAQAGDLPGANESLHRVKSHASEAKEYAQGCREWVQGVPLGTALPEDIVDYEDA